MKTKLVFVTGGVVSSLGKGITAAGLGRLLKSRGFSVSIMKLDPYLNVDPGTMNPYQHGEVFVTDDGAETDLDIGHYERFIDEQLGRINTGTTGQIYSAVIERERQGGYGGGTVQIIPHITNEIKDRILLVVKSVQPDVLIVEIGGTVGDIESQPYLEAIRQLRLSYGAADCAFIHVTLVPYIATAGELKSKPTQHSVKELQSVGIQPDIIICRSDRAIGEDIRAKIALFCNIPPECVIENLDAPSLYQVPLMLEQNGLCRAVTKRLGLDERESDMSAWKRMVEKEAHASKRVEIAVVGKYVKLHDAYLSIVEALHHAGIANDAVVGINYIDAEKVTRSTVKSLIGGCDGLLIPGGFGERGLDGKLEAIRYARENNMPFFGICLGMQLACVEFARNVLGLKQAHSTEVDPDTPEPVITLMSDQAGNLDHIGGTLRLGGYECRLEEGTLSRQAYGCEVIRERHRHRYEFNNDYIAGFERGGMVTAGMNPERGLVEIMELPTNDWFVGVQFHPEFLSRPDAPHPLFTGFVRAALDYKA